MSAPPPPGDGTAPPDPGDDPTIDELLSMVNDLALGIHGDLSDMLNEATNLMEAYEGVEFWCLLHGITLVEIDQVVDAFTCPLEIGNCFSLMQEAPHFQ